MDFPIIFKQNARCSKLRLKIDYEKKSAVLILPKRYSKKKALDFLLQNKEWVIEKLENAPEKIVYKDKDTIEIIGKKYEIAFFKSSRRHSKINGNIIEVYGESEKIKTEILKIAKTELLKYAYSKAYEIAKKIDVTFNEITIKLLKSRYGSCSSKKNLNFNLILAFAPVFVLDMVIAHEIVHLKHMNHSQEFKRVLDHVYERSYEADVWLKTNHKTLFRFI